MRPSPSEPDDSLPEHGAPFVKRRADRLDSESTEATLLRRLAGPGIVPLESGGSDSDDSDLRLTRAAGSVADVLAERGPLPETEARSVGVAVAGALERIHEVGLVHADIKPANLLLTGDHGLWVADFDAARAADGRPIRRATPGRIRTGAVAEPGTDVVALAVTLAEITTGVAPDPNQPWRSRELTDLGCPNELARDLSRVLGNEPTPSASDFGATLARRDHRRLPAPAHHIRAADPDRTLDFDPVVAPPAVRPAPPSIDPSGISLKLLAVTVVVVLVVLVVL